MRIKPLNPVETQKMYVAGKLAAHTLDYITPFVKAGITTQKLDDLMGDFILGNGGKSACLGYKGYPKNTCISLNDCVCHGIPSEQTVLKGGDIANIDVTVIVDGFHGDTSRMFAVGNVSPAAKQLMATTHAAMMAGIETIRSGSRLNDIGTAIEGVAKAAGYGIVTDYCGHGIGRHFHAEPQVLHFEAPNFPNPRLSKGMAFTVEPMLNIGKASTTLDKNGWEAFTTDGSLSAQWEHTVIVTENGYEITTLGESGQA